MFFRKKFNENSLKNEVAIKVVNFLLKVQIKFSRVMNEFTKKISVKNLKILLVGFCLLGGGFSIYLIAEAIFEDGQPALKIEKINLPKYYDQDRDLQTTYPEDKNFRKYMDSLQQIKLDSIKNVFKNYNSSYEK
jgi:hypothetical protein